MTSDSANKRKKKEKRRLSKRDWLFVGALSIAMGIFAGAIVGFLSRWTLWNVDEFSAYGAWASALGATLLALASVWLTWKSNEAAANAEELARNDIQERRLSDLRDREYQATELVMKGISSLVSEVYSYKEYVDGQPTYSFRPMSQAAPKEPLERRRELRRSCNESATEIRLALMQIVHPKLQNEGAKVMEWTMKLVRIIFPKDQGHIDIDAAVETVDVVNLAGLEFQKAADRRFRNDGQYDDLEFPQMYIYEEPQTKPVADGESSKSSETD